MRVELLSAEDHSVVLGLAEDSDTQLEEPELTRDCARVWVARRAPGEPALAFLLAWRVADEVHLINIVTAEAARRQGIGRLLMRQLMDYAAEVQARIVVLEVRRSNHTAIRLYRFSGFCAIGLRRRYYADGEDAVEMLATLDPTTGEVQPGQDEIKLS